MHTSKGTLKWMFFDLILPSSIAMGSANVKWPTNDDTLYIEVNEYVVYLRKHQ